MAEDAHSTAASSRPASRGPNAVQGPRISNGLRTSTEQPHASPAQGAEQSAADIPASIAGSSRLSIDEQNQVLLEQYQDQQQQQEQQQHEEHEQQQEEQQQPEVQHANEQDEYQEEAILPQPGRHPAHGMEEASSSSLPPEAHQQRYLKLLNSGRLASKRKVLGLGALQGFKARPLPSFLSGQPSDTAQDGRPRSVHDPHMTRLRTAEQALDVAPLVTIAVTTHDSDRGTNPSHKAQQRTSQQGSVRRAASAQDPVRVPGLQQPVSASWAPGQTLQVLGLTATLPPHQKILTPGPGSYGPKPMLQGPAHVFGTARQRPPHVCIHDNVVSPGPVYQPKADPLSTLTSPVLVRFGKTGVMSRYDYHSDQRSNCPHWNPGPGAYENKAVKTGGKTEAGSDAPKPVFGLSDKLVRPEERFSATVFVSHVHAAHENVGVHSPGPAHYSPDPSAAKVASACYSLSAKASSYFDAFLDPMRQVSPGPVYSPAAVDRWGKKPWGSLPHATFGKAPKDWRPEENLSAAPFVTEAHAQHVNKGVHSPGPFVYSPTTKVHIPSPLLASGQHDRFYNRLELGRVG